MRLLKGQIDFHPKKYDTKFLVIIGIIYEIYSPRLFHLHNAMPS